MAHPCSVLRAMNGFRPQYEKCTVFPCENKPYNCSCKPCPDQVRLRVETCTLPLKRLSSIKIIQDNELFDNIVLTRYLKDLDKTLYDIWLLISYIHRHSRALGQRRIDAQASILIFLSNRYKAFSDARAAVALSIVPNLFCESL